MRFQHTQFTKQIWMHKKHKKVQRELEVTQVFYLCFDRFEDSDVFNQQLLLVLCCSHFYPYRVLVMVFEDACNNLSTSLIMFQSQKSSSQWMSAQSPVISMFYSLCFTCFRNDWITNNHEQYVLWIFSNCVIFYLYFEHVKIVLQQQQQRNKEGKSKGKRNSNNYN